MLTTEYNHSSKKACQSVSIIITTQNEEKNLEPCLLSIQNQFFSKEILEIIVIDNNSCDKTRDIAQNYTDKVFIKGPERSAQRNYGMKEVATGKYVMYIDADMILSPSLIRTCVETINTKNYGSDYWEYTKKKIIWARKDDKIKNEIDYDSKNLDNMKKTKIPKKQKLTKKYKINIFDKLTKFKKYDSLEIKN